jgi:hypothetical protein
VTHWNNLILGFDLDLWPPKVIWGQNFQTIRKPMYDFLFDFYGHHLPISYHSQDNAGLNFEGWTEWRILTFQGQGHASIFVSKHRHHLFPNGVVWDIAHENRFCCLGCTRVKERGKLKEKKKKEHTPLYVGHNCVPQSPEHFSKWISSWSFKLMT